MTVYDEIITQQFERGKADALDLRDRAKDMDGTGIIAEERKVPVFDVNADYTAWPVGAPVRELVDGEYQVFTLNIPHNPAHYPGVTPNTNRTLWSITHTTDPLKAKEFTYSNGTSGMWYIGEVCKRNGHIWRSKQDGHSQPPGETGTENFWDDLGAAPKNNYVM